MHREFRWAPVILALFAVAATQPARSQGQDQYRRQQTMLRSAREASNAFEGTWVLQQRYTPSGRPHKQPLRGEFTVKLPVDASAASRIGTNGVAVMAKGSYQGFEAGVMDSAFSDFNPGTDVINPNPGAAVSPGIARGGAVAAFAPQATRGQATRGGDVLFEMKGNSELAMEMNVNSANEMELVFQNLELKGTYGVFRQGVRGARVPATYQMKTRRVLFFNRGTTLSLKDTFGSSALDIPRTARGPGAVTDKSHDIVKHVIRGNRMEITYGNGGRDIWVRKR